MADPEAAEEVSDRKLALTTAAALAASAGLENGDPRARAAFERGVTHFDSSIGGLGGCPFAPGASGNVCTEDLVGLFESMGIATGIDLDRLLATAEFCEQALGRELHGRVTRSGLNPLGSP